ncbi:cytochrome P450 [Plectosphaerella plurivora]|uniref:Cytochrome P450 n=1 Tax=Plectosphaerella plurivora TaxID=936078 RepID=A0A9P8VGF0_9PEZI|nr:cytochrome P450 [Plectosphaerella plurivora]
MGFSLMPSSLVLRALVILPVAILARGIYALVAHRRRFRRVVAEAGVKTLPGHSFIFGHLITVGKVMEKYPSNTVGQAMPLCVIREYPELAKQGFAYIDIWPITPAMFAAYHPDVMAQFTQDVSRPKHSLMAHEFYPMTKLLDLVNSEGAFWKKWRSAFNPGFSAQNVMALVPAFVEEALVLKSYLEDVARSGETIALEDRAMLATCDVISRAVLGVSLDIQSGNSKFFKALKKAVALVVTDWSPPMWSRILNPMRRPLMWYYNRVMRNELRPLIEKQLLDNERTEGPKTINSLAIRAYVKEAGGTLKPGYIDPEFLDVTVEQLKIFLFAGHDTTATTLCFAWHMLHHNPESLERVRAEHDAVFGPDPAAAAALITETPTLLNQLTYTSAVIKETLRLYPPIGSVREGAPDFFLVNPNTGERCLPTNGFMLFSCSKALQRSAEFWDEPDTWRPERWLGDEPSTHRKNAYRPFELGLRGCIGQELALTELRMILALTSRDLEIIPTYGPDDPVVFGSQAYQVNLPKEITAHPAKGLPAKVKFRKVSKA